jgi:hypothetical protein
MISPCCWSGKGYSMKLSYWDDWDWVNLDFGRILTGWLRTAQTMNRKLNREPFRRIQALCIWTTDYIFRNDPCGYWALSYKYQRWTWVSMKLLISAYNLPILFNKLSFPPYYLLSAFPFFLLTSLIMAEKASFMNWNRPFFNYFLRTAHYLLSY